MNVADPTSPERAPQRILYVITKANWGGAQRYVYDLALAARERGSEVSVAYGTDGTLSERLMQAHVPLFFVKGLGRDVALFSDLRALLNLMRLMHTLQPDVIHANSSKAGLLATVAARLYKKSVRTPRVIFTAHGWAFNESRPGWQKLIFAFFHAVTAAASDLIICVSEAARKDAERLPFTKGKLHVIHNGVEEVVLIEKDAARAKLAPAPSPVLSFSTWIGTLAELHPTKGLDVAIEAFARLASQFPDIALVLIGEGQQRNQLVELARARGLQDRIRFCGHMPHAATLLSAFDIFLFPSRSEGLGYAALEAGNASLPVVASRAGGIPEIIEDGISGLLVTPNDVDGFTNALASLLTDTERRTRLGEALHNRVHTSFSVQQMIENTLALYSV
jgi:glycosyltransferase involved in cell wall biosynthesis